MWVGTRAHGRMKGVGHRAGATEPDGRHSDRPMPEARPGQVVRRSTDHDSGDTIECHRARVALAHSDGMPRVRHRGSTRMSQVHCEQSRLAVDASGHECVGADGRPRTPRLGPGQEPPRIAAYRFQNRSRGFRSPHAPDLATLGRRAVELVQNRDRIGVCLGPAAQDGVVPTQRSQRLPPVVCVSRAGESQIQPPVRLEREKLRA
ncbi:hypothetical protein SRABI91_01081 [Rhodococcoides fascians]|nr:hypothetical protein SRABI91_01081 [Rhodococcus fascians]